MAALAANKRVLQYAVDPLGALYPDLPLAAAVHLFVGSAVGPNAAGDLVTAGATAATGCVRVLGVNEVDLDNSAGGAGALRATRIRRGAFVFANLAADLVTAAMVGATVFAADDQTVAGTDGGAGARPAMGKFLGFLDADTAKLVVEVGV